MNRRDLLLSAACATLVALAGCKLRVENPLLRRDDGPFIVKGNITFNDNLIQRDSGWRMVGSDRHTVENWYE